MLRLLDRMGQRYHRLPSELVDLSPEDLTLNALCIMQHDQDATTGGYCLADVVPVIMVEVKGG